MRHWFKSSYGQCHCLWCGRGRHGGPTCISDEVKAAVAEFAIKHGRKWRAYLRELWLQGKDDGILRQARNSIGPRQLEKINYRMIHAALPQRKEGAHCP